MKNNLPCHPSRNHISLSSCHLYWLHGCTSINEYTRVKVAPLRKAMESPRLPVGSHYQSLSKYGELIKLRIGCLGTKIGL